MPEPGTQAVELLDALLEGDRSSIHRVLVRALRGPATRAESYATVVGPAMQQVGALWQLGALSVAEEHRASELLIGLLHELRADDVVTPAAPSAIVACAPGEQHALPAPMAADVLRERGWRVCALGASLPADDLLRFVASERPRLLVLCVTMQRNLVGAADVLSRMSEGPERPRVVMGGAALVGVRDATALGADLLGRTFTDLPHPDDEAPGAPAARPMPERAAGRTGAGWS